MIEKRCQKKILREINLKILTLLLERKVLGEVTALVVAAEQEQRGGVADLEGPQVEDTLDAEVAAVHVVAQEQVLGSGRRAAHLEQFHQVVELAVDVAAYSHWCLDVDHRVFRLAN